MNYEVIEEDIRTGVMFLVFHTSNFYYPTLFGFARSLLSPTSFLVR